MKKADGPRPKVSKAAPVGQNLIQKKSNTPGGPDTGIAATADGTQSLQNQIDNSPLIMKQKKRQNELFGKIIQKKDDTEAGAEAERVRKLNENYTNALNKDPRNYQEIAELLNAFNAADITSKLSGLKQWEIASIHQGAIDNQKVGSDSAVAKLTNVAYLDMNYNNEVKNGNWKSAAKFMNAFNEQDIFARIKNYSKDKLEALQKGATENPEVGPQSAIALICSKLIKSKEMESKPVSDADFTKGLADTATTDPKKDKNYIGNLIVGGGIPVLGGPIYLKRTKDPGWQDSIVVPRSDFYCDTDPLAGGIDLFNVYESREAAMKAVSSIPQPNVVTYYKTGGIILPTKVSETTIPGLCPYVKTLLEDEKAYAKAASKLSVDLLFWYAGARFPLKVSEGAAAAGITKEAAYLKTILGADYSAMETAAAALKASNPALASLSVEEIVAIRAYTGEYWSGVNAALRFKDAKELAKYKQYAELINSGLSKLPNYTGQVKRYVSFSGDMIAKYKEGAVIVEDGFSSSTAAAGKVSNREGNVVFIIESVSGKNVSAIAQHASELEVLFRAGTKFAVTKVRDFGTAAIITMKDIGL